MRKIKKFILLITFMLLPVISYADGVYVEAMIGDKPYEKLEYAVTDAKNGDTIKVMKNVFLEETLRVGKNITIDLNNHNIDALSKVILIENGNLTLTGEGVIKEDTPELYAIELKGSKNADAENYSVLTVGKDVTLEGYVPLFVNQLGTVTEGEEEKNYPVSYGVVVDVYGTLNSKNDADGNVGMAAYVNGNIKHKENYPVINIHDDATLTSNGPGIYMAGYSKFNIDKATITGMESGIAMKSGLLNLNGAKVYCNGEKHNPENNNDGIDSSGAAIQIESNKNYAGDIKIAITDGYFYSKNTYSILEYKGNNDTTTTSIKDISIANGTFISNNETDTLMFSNEFNRTGKRFISGGLYTKSPTRYVNWYYKVVQDGDMYKVVSVMSNPTVATEEKVETKNSLSYIVIGSGLLAMVVIGYFILTRKKRKL